MKDNLTEIVFILDQSGSMSPLQNDTIGGYNQYVEGQKAAEGEAYLTTVLFDTGYELLHDHVNIQDVEPLTTHDYWPSGGTALMDAIGRTINSVGKRLSDTPEEERPAHVIFVITTDGYENSSHEFTREQVKQMVKHQQEKYSWQFIFIGAGIDAYQEAESIGLGGHHTMSVHKSGEGTAAIYNSVTIASNALRSAAVATLDSLQNSWKTGDIGSGESK